MSLVRGHSRKDGTYVQPYQRSGAPAAVKAAVKHHPSMGENGEPIEVKKPSQPSAPSTWHNPDAAATFVPDGDHPMSLNGAPMTAWRDHPRTVEGWDYLDGINEELDEPAFHAAPGKAVSAGVIIEEPDGRIWLTAPTNQFGGYQASFPKGTADDELSLQATAIKEAFEETGLKVEITGFVGDFDRTTSKVRMYKARRVGGNPARCGWESQAIHLVPKGLLYQYLNMWSDQSIAEAIGAGPAPKKPELKQSNLF